MTDERRSVQLPCNHQFSYTDVMLGKNIIRCCCCNWIKDIGTRTPRKTDLPYEEFLKRKEAEK